jgi:hypothetical protein
MRVEVELAHSDWALQIQRIDLLSAERYKRGLIWTIQITHTLLVLILIYLYIPLILSLFPWTEPLAQPFVHYFKEPLAQGWEVIWN